MRAMTWILAVLGGIGALVAPTSAANPSPSSVGSTTNAPGPDFLMDAIRVALRQELAGNDVDRNSLLLEIVDQGPEFAPARWHLGYVKANDVEWVPYRRFVDDEDERWQQLFLYRQNREERGDTIADHLYMADGARERGMWDEERAHLTRVVELDRNHEEARRRLGDVRMGGAWVSREEVDRFARRLLQTRLDLDEWQGEVNRIVRRLLRARQTAWETAWQDLAGIRDPAAIPAVETALAGGDARAAEWYLEWLHGLDAWEASAALTRQAVLAPSSRIRSRAQQMLRERRIDDYAPILLGAIRADAQSGHRLFQTPFGGLLYVRTISFETQGDIQEHNLAVLYGPERAILRNGTRYVALRTPALDPQLRSSAVQHLHRYYSVESASGGDIAAGIHVSNDRLLRTLAVAVGNDELLTPEEWWDWWNGYQQVFEDGVKPRHQENYEEYWTAERRGVERRREADRQVLRVSSCFAAGTPVITEYGPKPIEEILLGDRVLSQDVETGEIAFKPVFKTTVRPPVPLVTITTDDGALNCTPGHPFWINGLGWRYAWELQPGMRFHSVDGSSEIISLEDCGREEPAYNLVVADYHNYFVGEDRILSHDNSPRNPTNALVPGLMPDWSATVEESGTEGH